MHERRGKNGGHYPYYFPICKKCLLANFNKWAKKNIEHLRERDKLRRKNPKRKKWLKKHGKRYYKQNIEKITEYRKSYHQKHAKEIIERVKEWNREYKQRRRQNDLNYRIMEQLRGRIHKGMRGGLKTKRTIALIGCSIEKLKKHLSAKFKSGMSWDNYGKWHIDHICPCASFDLTKPKQQKICFNYKNLQPLWEYDNLSKGAKIQYY